MNLSQFFRHWAITENPFRGEEARNDVVLQRLRFAAEQSPATGTPLTSAAKGPSGAGGAVTLGSVHSDFEKILGELTRPSTSVVFGEKGSGKTAIKLQILGRIEAHNRRRPDAKVLVVPYDELNPYIAELHERYGNNRDPLTPFRKVRLVDHMDAVLSIATDRLVAGLFREGPDRDAVEMPDGYVKTIRALPLPTRLDLLVLQALYDPADVGGERTAKMRRLLRLPLGRARAVWNALTVVGWVPAVAIGVLAAINSSAVLGYVAGGLGLLYLGVIVKTLVFDRLRVRMLARRVRSEMRTLPRNFESLARSLDQLESGQQSDRTLPAGIPGGAAADEPRYHLMGTVRRVLAKFGYTGMLVLIDRVDEPTLVNGDAEKMRELMWPLFNNKFLQQDGLGVKMLLPIELRHALFRESAAFFQEARLDKQSLVERLTWTGPMLYDLCNARLHACREPSAEPISLIDLFAEDVSRGDVVEALDQMHQPRDAFKMLYRCMNEHCAGVTAEESAWQIPKHVLDQVRRIESDRVQSLYRGIGPA